MSSITIKTVVVHGATGLQGLEGGSVARELAQAGYSVRAVVRDSQAPKAKELAMLEGVQLVQVDLLDAKGLEEAYSGVDAVFACTAPNPHELQQGLNMAGAAAAAGVRLFVWSALESIAELTKDNLRLRVPVFDNKAAVVKHLATLGTALPHVNLYLGGFMENFVNFPGLARYIASEDTIELQYSGFRTDVLSLE
ncbi:NAD(P)-binding protein [Auricularia subglabra TFB-10046 SS5]|nr:NAD(P)-binding protein [Auricularia subglabra TFB-10046 SS5]